MNEKGFKLPQKTIIVIVAGFVLLFGTGIGVHLVFTKNIDAMQQHIDENTHRLEVFKKLYPTYHRLVELNKKLKEQVLIPYSSERIPERDISGFLDRLEKICQQTGMHFVSAAPQPESIQAEKQRILVNSVVRGDFKTLRPFLIQLLQTSSLVFIEQIQVRSVPSSREYTLRLWVYFT